MSRLLAMQERRVDSSARGAYLASLDERRASAAARQAHFWVFEHAGEAGRFMEFIEGGSADAVRSALGDAASAALWREVKGA